MKKGRIILFFILLTGAHLLLGLRLFRIQISNHKSMSRIAKSSYSVKPGRSTLPRGEIYDRNGLPLAINRHTYSVGFNRNYGEITPGLVRAVAESLDISSSRARRKLNRCRGFRWLVRHLKPGRAESLFKYRDKGLEIIRENSRYYPQGALASSVVGCVGTDNQGLSGIEYNFENLLKGRKLNNEYCRDARGRIIQVDSPGDGSGGDSSIRLTIDSNLQYIAERELEKGYRRFKPNWALAIIQDPSNGEILAMASYPSFDPNTGVPEDISRLKNKSVSVIFEPGSTFKVVTAAAALEEDKVSPSEIIDCEDGVYEVGGIPINDFEPHEKLSFEECIVHSSNIGLAKVGERLGEKLLFKYARDFGFGNFSGIRLPGETRGIFRKPDRWSGTSLSRISFGQEIGVTAIQLTGSLSAIANGGVLYEPKIVAGLISSEREKEYSPLPIRKVISPETSRKIRRMMVQVVERGSGVQAAVPGYRAAGKTGTAQKFNLKAQCYEEGKFTALFGGFLPADNPRLTILVVFDEPDEKIHWGGYVAAPVFREIAKASLSYLNIGPCGEIN